MLDCVILLVDEPKGEIEQVHVTPTEGRLGSVQGRRSVACDVVNHVATAERLERASLAFRVECVRGVAVEHGASRRIPSGAHVTNGEIDYPGSGEHPGLVGGLGTSIEVDHDVVDAR